VRHSRPSAANNLDVLGFSTEARDEAVLVQRAFFALQQIAALAWQGLFYRAKN
jgi:hypothetical protein